MSLLMTSLQKTLANNENAAWFKRNNKQKSHIVRVIDQILLSNRHIFAPYPKTWHPRIVYTYLCDSFNIDVGFLLVVVSSSLDIFSWL